MNPLRKYWIAFLIVAIAYVACNYLWIDEQGTLGKTPKLVMTIGCMVFLGIASVVAWYDSFQPWYRLIPLWIQSILLWAIIVDAGLGLTLHADIFYMSENTWPDKQLLVVVQNGELYFVFKCILLLVISGLNKWMRS